MSHQNGSTRDAFIELVDEHNYLRNRNRRAFLTDERLLPIIGSLWNCTDIMPGDLCEALDLQRGSTYAQGVRSLRIAVTA